MRIHLGHHFYGAGNLGDDFMLAGFLSAMRGLTPAATFTCCVPFARELLAQRFPEIGWLPYDEAQRARAIRECDVWLGLGGSPFQSAQSRWFIDHLMQEAVWCTAASRPMFFLGIGVQSRDELAQPDVTPLCTQAAAIWTRDATAAECIAALPHAPRVEVAADLAHVYFRATPPPPATRGRVTVVANFDYGPWPGQGAVLDAVEALAPTERTWLCQETRDLPGAERALFAALPAQAKARWQLVSPDIPGAPLRDALQRWPSGEWLITSRYHAALAGAWAGSKIIILSTNEKLRSAARDLGAPLVSTDADQSTLLQALHSSAPAPTPHVQAERALAACADFMRSAVAHQR